MYSIIQNLILLLVVNYFCIEKIFTNRLVLLNQKIFSNDISDVHMLSSRKNGLIKSIYSSKKKTKLKRTINQ